MKTEAADMQKKTIVVFGIGQNYKLFYRHICAKYNIAAITDNDSSKWHKIEPLSGKEIIPPSEINKLLGVGCGKCGKILVTPTKCHDIILQLNNQIHIQQDEIGIDILHSYSSHYGLKEFKTIFDGNEAVLIYDRIKIKYRIVNDLHLFSGVIVNSTYQIEYPFCNSNKNVIAIDIGMNIGCASLYFANMANVEKVYSFEPFEENYLGALQNFALNPNISHKILPKKIGLSNTNERQEISKGYACRGYSPDEYVSIELKDASEELFSVIMDNYEKRLIWLKCDCEGKEYDIFESLDNAGLLSKIHIITMEWHHGEQRFNYLKNILLKNNFALHVNGYDYLGMIYGFKIF
jgi:FkbM family methyltransferase